MELKEKVQEQFEDNIPWGVVDGSPIIGGHDTAAVGYDEFNLLIVTWGQVHRVEWPFFSKYMDEGLAYFSEEMLEQGKSLEGFNVTQLQADLSSL